MFGNSVKDVLIAWRRKGIDEEKKNMRGGTLLYYNKVNLTRKYEY